MNLGNASICVVIGLGARWLNHAGLDHSAFHYTGKILTSVWDGAQWCLDKIGEYAAGMVPEQKPQSRLLEFVKQGSSQTSDVWQSKSFLYGTVTYGTTILLCLAVYAAYNLAVARQSRKGSGPGDTD